MRFPLANSIYLFLAGGVTEPRLPCYLISPSRNLDHPSPNLPTPNMADRNRSYHEGESAQASRSRSPHRHHHRAHRTRSPQRHHDAKRRSPAAAAKKLPYNSRQLTKHDYSAFKPMFALYLDIQKGKVIDELDEVEVKGRWKSFIGKW